jgi:hypothetical protein
VSGGGVQRPTIQPVNQPLTHSPIQPTNSLKPHRSFNQSERAKAARRAADELVAAAEAASAAAAAAHQQAQAAADATTAEVAAQEGELARLVAAREEAEAAVSSPAAHFGGRAAARLRVRHNGMPNDLLCRTHCSCWRCASVRVCWCVHKQLCPD